jgi:hypothetical protein
VGIITLLFGIPTQRPEFFDCVPVVSISWPCRQGFVSDSLTFPPKITLQSVLPQPSSDLMPTNWLWHNKKKGTIRKINFELQLSEFRLGQKITEIPITKMALIK